MVNLLDFHFILKFKIEKNSNLGVITKLLNPIQKSPTVIYIFL